MYVQYGPGDPTWPDKKLSQRLKAYYDVIQNGRQRNSRKI